ncbi:kinase-like domain-containing protein [Durotheca rogersii]|uniref:kinase-like domain-containing protein n=1 Tax=Durotheca rogersii TaxID=419775 RepID=UPI00221F2CB5|nr:kinase-like domain-containing protein [Durotheca rogersii]KAI5860034.1 kinase-like domain-containing protein [Durotheca rogersii]
MPLACYSLFGRLAYRTSIRMASTIVGKSGRVYVQGEVLQRNRGEKFSIFKAESGNESFVLKRVQRPFYDMSLRLAAEFAGTRRLRMHIDCNEEEGILVYPYFRCTLLALIKEDPDFPPPERQKILRCVGEAIQELHSKDWIHIDVKPDNILVNWTCDREGNKTVTDAALGDFDIAFKLEPGLLLRTRYAVGNVMWRSPEGQTGRGVTKASDIFSFGLVCIYALGGGELLLLNDYQELAKTGIPPEQEILTRHFCYFGLVPEGLLKQVDSEDWCDALKGASTIAEEELKERPELRFEWWGKGLGPEAVNMISGMTNPDPAARITIEQVLAHRWWQETS